MGVIINHVSAYARDPKAAAENLAALAGGQVRAFHPLPGGWACLFDGHWGAPLVEFYPRTATLAHDAGQVTFRPLAEPARGGGAHLNLSLDRTRAQVEEVCRARGLAFAWREWASFLDVWLEEDLLVECVCREDDRPPDWSPAQAGAPRRTRTGR